MDDRFARLTENELARGSGCGGAPPHSGWKAIVPIPDGVRLPDLLVKKCCPSGYSIRSAWRYRTPAGGVSGFVVRYDEPGTDRKEFKPFTYCERAAGKREWRCRGMPEPRPLFNLDLLAAKPDAPVLVCEGEKSAARAARIFPESVCLTSAGGCKAWKQADWSPLAGRKVLIWPDCDEPGEEYSGEVAHIIHELGCSVSVVDAVALASLAPNGGQREPEKGWDAADAVAEWRDMAALLWAAKLLEWLQGQPGGMAGISAILTHGPNALRTKAAAEEALAVLAAHGWTVEVSNRPRIIKAVGGRSGESLSEIQSSRIGWPPC